MFNTQGKRHLPAVYHRLFISLAVSALVLLIWGIRPLSASSPPFPSADWAKWTVNIDFLYNNINAELQIEVGDSSGSLGIHNQSLYCYVVGPSGSVILTHDRAQFDGSGHIICDMPSLQLIIFALTDKWMTGSTSPNEAEGIVSVGVEDRIDLVGFGSEVPILYHPDIRFDLHQIFPGQWANGFKAGPYANPIVSIGPPFVMHPGTNHLSSYLFDCHVGFDCQVEHMMNGWVNIQPTPKPAPRPWWSHSGPTQLHIGHSPITGNTLVGSLAYISVDPPNTIISND